MPTMAAAVESMYQRFVTGWSTSEPTIPYTFDNEAFDHPDGRWVRVSVRHTDRRQETLGRVGNRRYRQFGNIMIQLFDLTDRGVKRLSGMFDSAKNIFEGVSFDGVDCDEAAIPREIPPDGKWIGLLLTIPFDYDEKR